MKFPYIAGGMRRRNAKVGLTVLAGEIVLRFIQEVMCRVDTISF